MFFEESKNACVRGYISRICYPLNLYEKLYLQIIVAAFLTKFRFSLRYLVFIAFCSKRAEQRKCCKLAVTNNGRKYLDVCHELVILMLISCIVTV